MHHLDPTRQSSHARECAIRELHVPAVPTVHKTRECRIDEVLKIVFSISAPAHALSLIVIVIVIIIIGINIIVSSLPAPSLFSFSGFPGSSIGK